MLFFTLANCFLIVLFIELLLGFVGRFGGEDPLLWPLFPVLVNDFVLGRQLIICFILEGCGSFLHQCFSLRRWSCRRRGNTFWDKLDATAVLLSHRAPTCKGSLATFPLDDSAALTRVLAASAFAGATWVSRSCFCFLSHMTLRPADPKLIDSSGASYTSSTAPFFSLFPLFSFEAASFAPLWTPADNVPCQLCPYLPVREEIIKSSWCAVRRSRNKERDPLVWSTRRQLDVRLPAWYKEQRKKRKRILLELLGCQLISLLHLWRKNRASSRSSPRGRYPRSLLFPW